MRPQAFQPGEIRDENDNIIQNGAYGKLSAFVNAQNDGILDYLMNNLEALKDMQTGAYMFVDSLPSTGDVTKVYVVKSTGKLYRWDAEGASWVPFDTAVNGVGISSADMDADGTLTLNLTNGKKASTTFKPLQEAAKIVNTAAASANTATDAKNAAQTYAQQAEATAKAIKEKEILAITDTVSLAVNTEDGGLDIVVTTE